MRPHVAAVYAFARIADDIADEGKLPAEERRMQLGAWQARLDAAMLPGEWLAVLDGCLAVTRQQFALGRAVCDGVRGRLRYELRLTWHGGMRVLDAVEEAAPYLLHHRPALGVRDMPSLLWRAFRWTDAS